MRTPRKQSGLKRPEARSLKVQPIQRFNRWSKRIVPEIKLCGNWLENLGFVPESRVIVHASKDLIVIRPQEPEED